MSLHGTAEARGVHQAPVRTVLRDHQGHTVGAWRENYISSIDLSSCSVQSIPISAKLERKRCESVRRKSIFSRSLVAQYTHRSPRLSLWCPPHTALEQGTSRRISQA